MNAPSDPRQTTHRPPVYRPGPASTRVGAESVPDRSSAALLPAANVPPELAWCDTYEDVRELGRGGMGVVYLARNVMMDRPEVLKVVSRELLTGPGAEERFLREIRSAASLQHPNVVTAYAAMKLGGLLVLAMEYAPGDDLAKVVAARGPRPVAEACLYAHQAAVGLQHAFEKGMVHRDVKPANLMLVTRGKKRAVKILDFGLAKPTRGPGDDGVRTRAGAMMGTPDYMAPEQGRDAASVDTRADVYALGCTLYFLLTGKPPFTGSSLLDLLLAHAEAPPPSLAERRPDVPAELAAVVATMMAKRPDHRYPTPGAAAAALVPFVRAGLPRPPASRVPPAGGTRSAPAPRPVDPAEGDVGATAAARPSAPPARRGRAIGAGAVTLVVATVVTLLAVRSAPEPSFAEPDVRVALAPAAQPPSEAQRAAAARELEAAVHERDRIEAERAALAAQARATAEIARRETEEAARAEIRAELLEAERLADRGTSVHGYVREHGPQRAAAWRAAAEGGCVEAVLLYGWCVKYGAGAGKDAAEAVQWFRKAADLGNATAMANLGSCYKNGSGVGQDDAEAVHWYRRAADLGHVTAMVSLGFLLRNGPGAVRDDAEAVRWYRGAADLLIRRKVKLLNFAASHVTPTP